MRYRLAEIVGGIFFNGNPFQKADQLWQAFQDNLVNYITTFEGVAEKIEKDPKRVDIDEVQDFINGN